MGMELVMTRRGGRQVLGQRGHGGAAVEKDRLVVLDQGRGALADPVLLVGLPIALPVVVEQVAARLHRQRAAVHALDDPALLEADEVAANAGFGRAEFTAQRLQVDELPVLEEFADRIWR